MSQQQLFAQQVNSMFGRIASRYDLLNSVLSGGTHHLWKRQAVAMLPSRPREFVVDLCTGTGDLLPLLAPSGECVVGVDFCLPMLVAGDRAQQFALVQGDGIRLPFRDGVVDTLSISFGVRNFSDLRAGLREAKRVLKGDGELLVLEFGQPSIPIWSHLYRFYSSYIMPKVGALVSGDREAYTYLPQTAAAFPCGVRFEEILRECEFEPQRTKPVFGGIAYIYLAIAHR